MVQVINRLYLNLHQLISQALDDWLDFSPELVADLSQAIVTHLPEAWIKPLAKVCLHLCPATHCGSLAYAFHQEVRTSKHWLKHLQEPDWQPLALKQLSQADQTSLLQVQAKELAAMIHLIDLLLVEEATPYLLPSNVITRPYNQYSQAYLQLHGQPYLAKPASLFLNIQPDSSGCQRVYLTSSRTILALGDVSELTSDLCPATCLQGLKARLKLANQLYLKDNNQKSQSGK